MCFRQNIYMSKKYTDLELINAVKTSFSIAEVCRKVGLKPIGGNYKTIHNKIDKLGLDTSHFTGKGWNVGLKFHPSPAKPLEEYLVNGSTYQSYKLAQRLLKEGYKERVCECCNNTL